VRSSQATRDLYNTLAWRHWRSPLFLYRCLRCASVQPPQNSKPQPSVRYMSGHHSFRWFQDVPRLGCLWCYNAKFTRFGNSGELLEHLQSCHCRFRYICNESTTSDSSEPRMVIKVRPEYDARTKTHCACYIVLLFSDLSLGSFSSCRDVHVSNLEYLLCVFVALVAYWAGWYP
jgi:hypothetical protein